MRLFIYSAATDWKDYVADTEGVDHPTGAILIIAEDQISADRLRLAYHKIPMDDQGKFEIAVFPLDEPGAFFIDQFGRTSLLQLEPVTFRPYQPGIVKEEM